MSQDPIGLEGGNPTLYGYVEDTNSWVDKFGLAKRGPKTKEEGGPHNDKIGEIAQKLRNEGYTIVAGGNEQPEVLIKTGGTKDRRPDIIAKKEGAKDRIINVGLTDANGKPIKREQEAIADLELYYGKGNVESEEYKKENKHGCKK